MDSTSADRVLLRQDGVTIGLIGLAHLMSHFFQLTMAPLFPRLHEAFGVSYVELGALSTCFYLCSGLSQAVVGILVDRYGARRMLLAGLMMMAAWIALSGLVTRFWMLYPLAVMGGLGNSVFHPADMFVLSARVSPGRLGRAFGIHQFCGTLGWALAPLVSGGLAAFGGWRVALIGAGVIGFVVIALLLRYGTVLDSAPAEGRHGVNGVPVPYAKLIASPAVMMAFGYFLLTSIAGTGFQTFSTASLVEFYGVPLTTAASALTAYLVGSAAGILVGGQLADRTARYVLVAMLGLAGCAGFILLVASGVLPFSLAVAAVSVAGLAQGMTAPSRDILVKMATPKGATGKVFGFVYSGLDAGSTLAPVFFGALLDRHAVQSIFLGIGLLYGVAVLSVLSVSRHRQAE